ISAGDQQRQTDDRHGGAHCPVPTAAISRYHETAHRLHRYRAIFISLGFELLEPGEDDREFRLRLARTDSRFEPANQTGPRPPALDGFRVVLFPDRHPPGRRKGLFRSLKGWSGDPHDGEAAIIDEDLFADDAGV